MKKVVFILLIFFAFPAMACQISSEQIIGSYLYEEGDTVIEAFELNADHTYTSWLHDRLESDGNWNQNLCTVTVEIEMFPTPIIFKLLSVTKESLLVMFDGLSIPAQFERVE